jgi:hypothetical protein
LAFGDALRQSKSGQRRPAAGAGPLPAFNAGAFGSQPASAAALTLELLNAFHNVLGLQ